MKIFNFQFLIFNLERGQALVTLLFFSIVAITITSAAVMITLSQTKTGSTIGLSHEVYYLAESGAENALLRLLRDSSYNGEQIILPNGTILIQITGTNPKTVISQASASGIIRRVKVVADYTNTILTVLSWKEL